MTGWAPAHVTVAREMDRLLAVTLAAGPP
jgi:predicted N-acyltransferase